jgi:hypothetical protein
MFISFLVFLRQAAARSGLLLLVLSTLLLAGRPALAQLRPSLTFGHETWPSVSVTNLEADASTAQLLSDLSVWTDTRFVQASYPFLLQNGRTYLDLQAGFQRIQFRHDAWPETVPRPTDAYVVDLNVLAQRQLSERWSLVGQLTPSLKSGLEDELIREDFAIEGAVLASRQVGERTVLGVGVAYTSDFGVPLPIPLLQLERQGALWSDGPGWRASALLPSTLETWVVPARRLEVGVQLRTLGNRHHLTGENTALSKPFSDYFDTVVGPSANVYLTSWMTVGVESGISVYRQMQVTDGRDEVISFEPDRAGFLRWQVTIGGQSPLAGQ